MSLMELFLSIFFCGQHDRSMFVQYNSIKIYDKGNKVVNVARNSDAPKINLTYKFGCVFFEKNQDNS